MILLLTHSGDFFTIDKVCDSLTQMGKDFFRVNTDLLPISYPMACEWGTGGKEELSIYLDEQTFLIGRDKITAVWARRMWPARFPDNCPPEVVQQCAPAASALVFETLGLLEDAHWINPLTEGKRAESKLLQLSMANELGFRVPNTLVSNHPEKIRDFFEDHNGDIITKLLVPQVASMEAHPNFSYTCRVDRSHLDHLEQVRGMPQIFQPFVKKVREYRVAVVGQQIFTGCLPIPSEGPLSVDWRQATENDDLNWERAELPSELQERIHSMMEELGLVFGAFDFAETPEGEFVFFEVNQAGEWGMLEHHLDLPISRAIAEELCT